MLCACVVAALVAVQIPAEPDFTGRWVLIADAPPADVPAVLVVQQHLTQTDVRGNALKPFWDSLTVTGDDSKSGIRSGRHRFGVEGGTVSGGIFGSRTSEPWPPRRFTRESVSWQGQALVLASERWMEREAGQRESYECHRETWTMTDDGRLAITVTDTDAGSRSRTLTYRREQTSR